MVKQSGRGFAITGGILFLLIASFTLLGLFVNVITDGYSFGSFASLMLDQLLPLSVILGLGVIMLSGQKNIAAVILLGAELLRVFINLLRWASDLNILSLLNILVLAALAVVNCIPSLAKVGKATRLFWLANLGLLVIHEFVYLFGYGMFYLSSTLEIFLRHGALMMLALWLTSQPAELSPEEAAAEYFRAAYTPPAPPVRPVPPVPPVRPVQPAPVPGPIQPVAAERPAPPPQPVRPVSADSDVQKLREYKALLDDGIITQAEFDAKKKQILEL